MSKNTKNTDGVPTTADLLAQIEALKAENAELAQSKGRGPGLSYKVSEKGCVSIYGTSARGTHLYTSQWVQILEGLEKQAQFMAANWDKLGFKAEDDRGTMRTRFDAVCERLGLSQTPPTDDATEAESDNASK